MCVMMGYETRYYLTVDGYGGAYRRVCLFDLDRQDNEGLTELRDLLEEGNCAYNWYHYEEDMVALSVRWPNLTFQLRGFGEDNSDIWVQYFRNGLTYREDAEVVFPAYDESKMRKPEKESRK